jgi:hypothetical protein
MGELPIISVVDQSVEIMKAYMIIDQPKKEKEWMNCLDIECYKYSHYQCKHNSDPIFASYWKSILLCHDRIG